MRRSNPPNSGAIIPAYAPFPPTLLHSWRTRVTSHLLRGRCWIPSSALSEDPSATEVTGAITASGVNRGDFPCPPPSRKGDGPPNGNSPFSLRKVGLSGGRRRGVSSPFFSF